jgi:hypothetical protein
LTRLRCEAKDTRLFDISEENSDTVLLEQEFQLAKSEPVTRDGDQHKAETEYILTVENAPT